MSWKEILKVDLREARMLGRKHAPEEMSEGKLKITIESALTNGILMMSKSDLYKLRRNQFPDNQLVSVIQHYGGYKGLPSSLRIKIHDVVVKPQKNRDRGDVANTLFDDAYPEEDAIITIEYSAGSIKNEKFSFALPPLTRNLSGSSALSNLRRPKTKRVEGGWKQRRNADQHTAFDRREDV
jgi:hypothetical protein